MLLRLIRCPDYHTAPTPVLLLLRQLLRLIRLLLLPARGPSVFRMLMMELVLQWPLD